MSESIFEKGLKLDVTKHIEKKGRFSYLSWAWAVQELRKLDPKAEWETMHFKDIDNVRSPYMATEVGYFVEVLVSLSDGTKSQQIHPVLDNSNKTIAKPNAFQINTSIQRCLVKAIALASGIGLHIYAGEDLPPGDEEPQKKQVSASNANDSSLEVFFIAIEALKTKDSAHQWKRDNQKSIDSLGADKGKVMNKYLSKVKELK